MAILDDAAWLAAVEPPLVAVQADVQVLRVTVDVPRWALLAGDYLIVRHARETAPSALCLAIPTPGEPETLCKVGRWDPDTFTVETADGLYRGVPDTGLRVVGVVTGIIRKY